MRKLLLPLLVLFMFSGCMTGRDQHGLVEMEQALAGQFDHKDVAAYEELVTEEGQEVSVLVVNFSGYPVSDFTEQELGELAKTVDLFVLRHFGTLGQYHHRRICFTESPDPKRDKDARQFSFR